MGYYQHLVEYYAVLSTAPHSIPLLLTVSMLMRPRSEECSDKGIKALVIKPPPPRSQQPNTWDVQRDGVIGSNIAQCETLSSMDLYFYFVYMDCIIRSYCTLRDHLCLWSPFLEFIIFRCDKIWNLNSKINHHLALWPQSNFCPRPVKRLFVRSEIELIGATRWSK